MKRRDFLKKAGIVIGGSLGLLSKPSIATEPKQEWAEYSVDTAIPEDADLFGEKVIKSCKNWLNTNNSCKPIEVDGKMYYVVMMRPKLKYELEVSVARDKYKHERWVERYNRWAETQGKPPYIEVEGEVGIM